MNRFQPEDNSSKDKRLWRERSTNKVFNSDTVFKDLINAVETAKRNQEDQLPPKLQPITPEEGAKFGYCENMTKEANKVREIEREKWYAQRRQQK